MCNYIITEPPVSDGQRKTDPFGHVCHHALSMFEKTYSSINTLRYINNRY